MARKPDAKRANLIKVLSKLENGPKGEQLKLLCDVLTNPISGERLEALYTDAGFTQLQIAAAIGMSARALRTAIYSKGGPKKRTELAIRWAIYLKNELAANRRDAVAAA